MTSEEMLATLLPERPRWYWQERALCVGDFDPWFPDAANQWYVTSVAQKYCNQCPVKAECLTVGWEEDDGIWAGTTGPERQRARRIQARQEKAA